MITLKQQKDIDKIKKLFDDNGLYYIAFDHIEVFPKREILVFQFNLSNVGRFILKINKSRTSTDIYHNPIDSPNRVICSFYGSLENMVTDINNWIIQKTEYFELFKKYNIRKDSYEYASYYDDGEYYNSSLLYFFTHNDIKYGVLLSSKPILLEGYSLANNNCGYRSENVYLLDSIDKLDQILETIIE